MKMNPQPDLDFAPRDICARNHGGADTSVAAHESIAQVNGEMCSRVMNYIRSWVDYGATCEEVVTGLGMKHQTVSARVTELLAAELIADSGRRRKTTSGRPARVLVATERKAA